MSDNITNDFFTKGQKVFLIKLSKHNIRQIREERRNSIEELGEFVEVFILKIRFDCPVNSIAEIREQKMELEEKYQRLLYPNMTKPEKLSVSSGSYKKEKEKEVVSKKSEEVHLDSATVFDSKERERIMARRERAERVVGKQASLGLKLDFPEPKFRNFTNIFGKKSVRKSSKPERVTLQSIMRSNWNPKIN